MHLIKNVFIIGLTLINNMKQKYVLISVHYKRLLFLCNDENHDVICERIYKYSYNILVSVKSYISNSDHFIQ